MKLILFDIDGTILNTGALGVKSITSVLKQLYKKPVVYDLNNLIGQSDTHNFAYLYKCIKGKKPTKTELDTIISAYIKELPKEIAILKKSNKYKPITGVENFLKVLQKYPDVKIALATGNLPEAAKLKLEATGLAKYFSFKNGGFGSLSADRQKLLVAGVKSCEKCFKTKFTPNDVFIIGDTYRDVLAAKENGYHSAVILEAGLGDKARLLRAAAELEVKDFKDVPLLLMWLTLKADPKGIKKGAYITPATAIEHVFFSRTGIDEDRLKMFKIKKYSDLGSGNIW